MLKIDYSRVPGITPFLRVLGLSLAERAVLAAQAAGVPGIAIVVDEDAEASLREMLAAQPRIRVPLSFARAPAAAGDDIVLPGDRVFTSAGVKGLLEGEWTLDTLPADHVAVASEGDVRAAEDMLLRSLTKAADGIVSRHINRRISLFLSRHIARYPVHPNHITAVVFLVGVASGFFVFFMDSHAGLFLGGLSYYVSAILDGCDGEISRLKYLGSPLGAWLDTIVDDLVGLSFILGLYGRLALDWQGPWPWIGLATIALYLATILPRYWVMTRTGSGDFQQLAAKKRPKGIEGPGKVVEAVRQVIFRTDFIPFYAFVTAASGYPVVFAVPFSVGTIASAADSLIDTVKVRQYLAEKG